MDYESLIERLKVHDGIFYSIPTGKNLIAEVTTTLSMLQAENEKLRAELNRCREKNAGLALALLTERAPNPDCLGDDEWRAIKVELEQVKAERDAAIDCIYKIVDAFD